MFCSMKEKTVLDVSVQPMKESARQNRPDSEFNVCIMPAK